MGRDKGRIKPGNAKRRPWRVVLGRGIIKMWRRHDPNEKTERDKRNGGRNMVEVAGVVEVRKRV